MFVYMPDDSIDTQCGTDPASVGPGDVEPALEKQEEADSGVPEQPEGSDAKVPDTTKNR